MLLCRCRPETVGGLCRQGVGLLAATAAGSCAVAALGQTMQPPPPPRTATAAAAAAIAPGWRPVERWMLAPPPPLIHLC